MKLILSVAITLLLLRCGLEAQTASDAAELTKLLKEFLAAASRNDAAMHDRFWADDLIYTGSSGRRIGKADIMREVRAEPPAKPNEPPTTYTAEDIRIQYYGETAIVAFRLVGTSTKDGITQVRNFLSTGTFLKRKGEWRAVSWQATAMPRGEGEARNEVAAAEATFHQAMLAGDVKKLEGVMEETFVWTHRDGEQKARKDLLEAIASKKLKYSKLETRDVTVSVYGETGIVRGVSLQQRSSFSGDGGAGDAEPFAAFYTLTFIYKGGDWKAVAMHLSGSDSRNRPDL